MSTVKSLCVSQIPIATTSMVRITREANQMTNTATMRRDDHDTANINTPRRCIPPTTRNNACRKLRAFRSTPSFHLTNPKGPISPNHLRRCLNNIGFADISTHAEFHKGFLYPNRWPPFVTRPIPCIRPSPTLALITAAYTSDDVIQYRQKEKGLGNYIRDFYD